VLVIYGSNGYDRLLTMMSTESVSECGQPRLRWFTMSDWELAKGQDVWRK
jgi:hypothetical protein